MMKTFEHDKIIQILERKYYFKKIIIHFSLRIHNN